MTTPTPVAFLVNDMRAEDVVPALRDAGFTVTGEVQTVMVEALFEMDPFASYADQIFETYEEQGGIRTEQLVVIVNVENDFDWMDVDAADAVPFSRFTCPGDTPWNTGQGTCDADPRLWGSTERCTSPATTELDETPVCDHHNRLLTEMEG